MHFRHTLIEFFSDNLANKNSINLIFDLSYYFDVIANSFFFPLYLQRAGVEKVSRHISDATEKGAKVMLGGNNLEGNFFEPTVLTDMTESMAITSEETFGPIAAIYPFNTEDEGIDSIIYYYQLSIDFFFVFTLCIDLLIFIHFLFVFFLFFLVFI